MHTYAKLKDGRLMIIWSDNTKEETMCGYPADREFDWDHGANNPPDCDLDWPQGDRERMIDYTREKYSPEFVSHIATFGTMKSRTAVKDAADRKSVV